MGSGTPRSESVKEKVPVHILMGGVDTEKWFLDPEKPAILIGTQDMLLSRRKPRVCGDPVPLAHRLRIVEQRQPVGVR